MMIKITDEEVEMLEKISKWETFDPKAEEFRLREDAPEYIKKEYRKLKRKLEMAKFKVIGIKE